MCFRAVQIQLDLSVILSLNGDVQRDAFQLKIVVFFPFVLMNPSNRALTALLL